MSLPWRMTSVLIGFAATSEVRLDGDGKPCHDLRSNCSTSVAAGDCDRSDSVVLECPVSCNTCHMVRKAKLVPLDSYGKPVECRNWHDNCEQWAKEGECSANPNYMLRQCSISCLSCRKLDFKNTCSKHTNTTPAISPGAIDKLFQNFESFAFRGKNSSHGLSQCRDAKDHNPGASSTCSLNARTGPPFISSEELQAFVPSLISRPPSGAWVAQFENILNASECDYLIHNLGLPFVVSSEANGRSADGRILPQFDTARRTSESAWCNTEECMSNPLVRQLSERISRLTGIPVNNSEHLQILRYQPGQRYVEHHDFVDAYSDLAPGPRIFTMFIYLSNVEEGGETHFTNLRGPSTALDKHFSASSDDESIKISPRCGRAVLWPNVLDSNVTKVDVRTKHSALPVIQGEKYAINAWLHLHDFLTPFVNGCAGS